MKTKMRILSALCALGLLAHFAFAQTEQREYARPERFESAIAAFEAQDAENPPPPDAIVCIGSSSMRGWHPTIHEDLAPLTVIPRGFGGSNMYEALHYADRIILPYAPRAIVLYEGDNDVAQEISPQKIAETFEMFARTIHDELPECRIYFLSIKPSIRRWSMWPQMAQANRLIAEQCERDERLRYVDVASKMLNDAGKPRPEIFLGDNLHMNRAGYVIWRDVLRPVLMESELQHETEKPTEDK